MPKSAYEWKRTENETQNARTKFQETGSPLERTLKACKSTGCMKNALERGIECSSWRPVYKTPRSSVRYPARADIKILGFPDCVLELQIGFPATLLACNGSNYTFTHANMLLIQDYNIRKLNFMIYLHACPKISQTHHQHAQIQTFKTYTPMICTCMWEMLIILNLDGTDGDQNMSFNQNSTWIMCFKLKHANSK